MKAIVSLLIIFISLSSAAQTVFPDNGTWKQKYHSIAWGHGGEILWDITSYNTLDLAGDTLVNGINFLKLNQNKAFISLLKVEGLRVFAGPRADSLGLLMDFNLNPGDTFRFSGPSYSGPADGLTRVVQSVDSVPIEGELRKRISFSEFPGYGAGPVWIQGIGDVNFGGIVLDYSYVAWFGNTTTLMCFTSDGMNLYGECTSGIPDPEKPALVSPNPSKGTIRIRMSEYEKPVVIKLFGMNGDLLCSRISFSGEESFDLAGQGKGVLILQITSKNKCETSRIIVL